MLRSAREWAGRSRSHERLCAFASSQSGSALTAGLGKMHTQALPLLLTTWNAEEICRPRNSRLWSTFLLLDA